MPSKGGSRGAGAAVPLADALAAAMVPLTQSPGPPAAAQLPFEEPQISRPLQRGPEVDRFNELAARQDSLTPEESDDLYRFRLRRCQTTARVLERSTYLPEEQIREALDRYRRRLRALRAFEGIRQEHGLPTGAEIDSSIETRAAERLLQLAQQRPPGLIAGSVEASAPRAGSVRVPPVTFAPAADDVPLYILASESQPSDSIQICVDAVAADGARVHLVHSAAGIPSDGPMPLVLNWGTQDQLPSDIVALNRPEAVRVAADQVESLRRFGELAPRTVVNPDNLGLLGTGRAVAKRRRGSQGRGKAVIPCDGPVSERAGFDLYQEFIDARREWRVSVLSGRIVSAYVKEPPTGTASDELHPNWSYRRADVLPRGVADAARQAAARVGLDYGGMDVVEALGTGRVLCLEANAAPGMSADTLRGLYGHVQQTLRGRQRRAG